MKRLILLLVLFAFGSSLRGQQIELIANTDGRRTISLDGEWQAIIALSAVEEDKCVPILVS